MELQPGTTLPAARYLSRPGRRIAYENQGKGPPVICVPGMGEPRFSFRFLVPALVEAGYRVLTAVPQAVCQVP